jgi:hypothetical protein
VSGGGKILRRKCHINNFRRKKRPGTLRMLGGKIEVTTKGIRKQLKRLMPTA